MREIERRDRRLADIGVDVTGQASEPGLDRVDALGDAREIASLDNLLHEPKLFVGGTHIGSVSLPMRTRWPDRSWDRLWVYARDQRPWGGPAAPAAMPEAERRIGTRAKDYSCE